MRESDALKKWCPFARAMSDADTPTAVNRAVGSNDADADCYCLGSKCMAWRRAYYIDGEAEGYCGIAGALHYE